jgi:ABC-type transporter Mla maintaining outer membrane lipid asymmetry ATPase subunit MlaF
LQDLEKQHLETSPFEPMILSWSGLSFNIDGKSILEDVSGHLSTGQMLAVMGPSGKFLSI